MPSIHRQLRDWCRRRQYLACEAFATALDDQLQDEREVTPDILLAACRRIRRTRFFRENRLDAEAVAQELTAYLEVPPLRTRIKGVGPDNPFTPTDVSNPTSEPPDIFLSYFHEDLPFVERLGQELAQAGYVVWYDVRGLTAGNSFPREIEKALAITRAIGVVCTPVSLERPWVKKEIEAGHYREGRGDGDVLIPIRLQPCDLPLLMATKQWCDFSTEFGNGLGQLIEALSG